MSVADPGGENLYLMDQNRCTCGVELGSRWWMVCLGWWLEGPTTGSGQKGSKTLPATSPTSPGASEMKSCTGNIESDRNWLAQLHLEVTSAETHILSCQTNSQTWVSLLLLSSSFFKYWYRVKKEGVGVNNSGMYSWERGWRCEVRCAGNKGKKRCTHCLPLGTFRLHTLSTAVVTHTSHTKRQ